MEEEVCLVQSPKPNRLVMLKPVLFISNHYRAGLDSTPIIYRYQNISHEPTAADCAKEGLNLNRQKKVLGEWPFASGGWVEGGRGGGLRSLFNAGMLCSYSSSLHKRYKHGMRRGGGGIAVTPAVDVVTEPDQCLCKEKCQHGMSPLTSGFCLQCEPAFLSIVLCKMQHRQDSEVWQLLTVRPVRDIDSTFFYALNYSHSKKSCIPNSFGVKEEV